MFDSLVTSSALYSLVYIVKYSGACFTACLLQQTTFQHISQGHGHFKLSNDTEKDMKVKWVKPNLFVISVGYFSYVELSCFNHEGYPDCRTAKSQWL